MSPPRSPLSRLSLRRAAGKERWGPSLQLAAGEASIPCARPAQHDAWTTLDRQCHWSEAKQSRAHEYWSPSCHDACLHHEQPTESTITRIPEGVRCSVLSQSALMAGRANTYVEVTPATNSKDDHMQHNNMQAYSYRSLSHPSPKKIWLQLLLHLRGQQQIHPSTPTSTGGSSSSISCNV